MLGRFNRMMTAKRLAKPKTQTEAIDKAVRSLGRPKPTWLVRLPDNRAATVTAFTKSEARAEAKRVLGIRSLPTGTTAERIVF